MPQRHVARSNPERINLYQQITDRIITDLEAGRVPWVQPWGTANAGIGMPHNAVSSRRYSGINVLTLWHAVVSRGFSNHAFLTFRQAVALGGSVRRGERGVGIIYTFEEYLGPLIKQGTLLPVLEDWWQAFDGPYLYYNDRRHVPSPLRAFVDFLKAEN